MCTQLRKLIKKSNSENLILSHIFLNCRFYLFLNLKIQLFPNIIYFLNYKGLSVRHFFLMYFKTFTEYELDVKLTDLV